MLVGELDPQRASACEERCSSIITSRADVAALNERFRTDRRASAAVLLLFVRAAGRTLDRFKTLPRALLHRSGEALGVRVPTIAFPPFVYARRQTFYEHQLWLKGFLGLADVDQAASDQLVEHLNACAREAVSIDELIVARNRWPYDHKFIIPYDGGLADFESARALLVLVGGAAGYGDQGYVPNAAHRPHGHGHPR